jgi:hypothetical protein
MGATKRPLNKCGSCGHTWYPKGRSVSVRCPVCKSSETKVAGPGIGVAVLVIAALVFLGSRGSNHPASTSEQVEVQPQAAVDVRASEPMASLNDANLTGSSPIAGSDAASLTTSVEGQQSVSTIPSVPAMEMREAANFDSASDATANAASGTDLQSQQQDAGSAFPAVLARDHH